MKPTSHDLMRKAMADHGINADDLIALIHNQVGGDRQRVADVVSRFVDGGPSCMAVCIAIIDIVAQQQIVTVH